MTGVGKGLEAVDEVIDLFLGELHRRYLSHELRVSNGIGEPTECLFVEWLHKEGFFLPVVEVAMGEFTKTSCLPSINPVGCLVAGAGKSARIHKGLCQQDRMAVDLLPIPGEPFQVEAQNP